MNRITTYIRQSLQDIYPPEEVKALSMLICCDMLGVDALDIYMGKDIILSACKQRELENIIFRLQKNEPIQYIRGYAEFCGRNFRVAPGVLIPRPETAELVALIVKENPDARRLLDIGTGSGCIAISLDKNLPDAKVDAWDISEEALAIARKNNEELDAQVTFRRQDVFSADGMQGTSYDIIVSNPPYVTETEKTEMEANVLDWEPGLALFVPDEDPLRFYRQIAELGRKLLRPGGKLYFEINPIFARDMSEMLFSEGYCDVRTDNDLFGRQRFASATR